jgi:hypothetical protein
MPTNTILFQYNGFLLFSQRAQAAAKPPSSKNNKKGEVSPSLRTLHSGRYARTFGAATSPFVWSYATPSAGVTPRNAPGLSPKHSVSAKGRPRTPRADPVRRGGLALTPRADPTRRGQTPCRGQTPRRKLFPRRGQTPHRG